MPIIKSAKKALRQNIRRRKTNVKRKTELKSVIKQFKKLVIEGKKEEAQKYLPQVYKKLDKSAKINLIKKNKASRIKSRLSKKLVMPTGRQAK
ncbi:30S ribosomal protein S20 [Candidatus Wolfebacteria bacterium CG02_land_8_20_14_3_00_37_12]|uniref:Small ribosomal subunit protein bS20 n=3 Tax=Candidatus Wolfeibacteriota TaxID=1752735 RepID=A0A2M7Q7A4_9BACT|nr:MAG: 30S ribosomal protein S20 [Candidatus Wolfebacteria bacterium CG02_land_8_20_14_3_00_37_12]PIY59243.1 MAG: 30S ribosomal protein S20 [Candidatus Wolfebacteria bacterium CG_4_10_14_0_8_um_filter_37_11]PJA41584.1 MAG: 30S ribosomal protein S20 [Candidatus Wolfebacteria bacterium CG_4_9_14_3_um_filter_37_9]